MRLQDDEKAYFACKLCERALATYGKLYYGIRRGTYYCAGAGQNLRPVLRKEGNCLYTIIKVESRLVTTNSDQKAAAIKNPLSRREWKKWAYRRFYSQQTPTKSKDAQKAPDENEYPDWFVFCLIIAICVLIIIYALLLR